MPETGPRTSAGIAKPLMVTLTGIAVTILVNAYLQRSALELQLIAQSALVERAKATEKVRVTYGNDAVAGLSRIELALVNSGRKAIRSSDIVSPITIVVDSGQVLDVLTEELSPPDLTVRFSIDSARRSVTLDAPLINPGDGVRFTLLVGRTPPPHVTASARIAGVRALHIADRRPENRPLWKTVTWPVYLASLGTVVAFLAFALFLYAAANLQRARHYWSSKSLFLPDHASPEMYAQALELTFGSDPGLEAKVRPILDQAAAGRSLSKEIRDALTATVEKHIRDVRVSSYRFVVGALFFFLMGSGYVLYSIARVVRGTP